MRADNSHHIVTAARRRATATRRRAIAALRRMDNAGQPISFDAVAREGQVSRSWLYNQPDLRAEIERLRARRDPGPTGHRLPDRQRASDASLRRRLEVATERNRQLEAENRHLREALAVALGEQRAASIVGQLGDTPKRNRNQSSDPADASRRRHWPRSIGAGQRDQATTGLKITFGEVLQLVGHLRAGAGGQIQVVQLIDADQLDTGAGGGGADRVDDVGDVRPAGELQAQEAGELAQRASAPSPPVAP